MNWFCCWTLANDPPTGPSLIIALLCDSVQNKFSERFDINFSHSSSAFSNRVLKNFEIFWILWIIKIWKFYLMLPANERIFFHLISMWLRRSPSRSFSFISSTPRIIWWPISSTEWKISLWASISIRIL